METRLSVEGMSCGNCAARVEQALNELSGVSAEVSLDEGAARVEHSDDVSVTDLQAAVEKAGYSAKPA